ncbi:MAG: hypothetical protein C0404_10840 [Verrucomicrobia bacterium]|nr:hypothetical protein [Verrucomicrobiota bacterium]
MPPEPQKTTWGTRRPERLLGALLDISNLVGSVMLLDDILDRIVRTTADLIDVPVCSIYLFDTQKNRLVLRSCVGIEADMKGRACFPLGRGIQGWVAQEGQIVSLADATVDGRYLPLNESKLENDCKAILCAPLRIQEEIIGVMTARKKEAFNFNKEQTILFETLCKQVSIVIEKSRMYEEKLKAEQLAAVAVSLSGIAHYIKNVLFTSQVGEYMVDKGLNEWNDLDRVREGWKQLHQANQKIRKLVEDMLNYSRKTELAPKPMNLGKLITEIVASIHEYAEQRHVELRTELDPQLDKVMLEPESMQDALLNLITNGIDAIPEKRTGTLTIRAEKIPDQSNIRIEVSDNGQGIPPDIRDKIFNLFFSTKGKRGTGIGLSVTKKIVEDHGGTIEFDSEDGKGTTFRIFLPLIRPV